MLVAKIASPKILLSMLASMAVHCTAGGSGGDKTSLLNSTASGATRSGGASSAATPPADSTGVGSTGITPSPSTGTGGASTGGLVAALTTLTYMPSTATLVNPERGFFNWVDLITNPSVDVVRASGHSLGFAVIRLDAYRTTALPAAFLQQLSAGLALARAAHIKVILRFAYNYPGSDPDGSAVQDASVAIIQQHTAQLQPVLAANVDVIAVVQAGFSGEWGEWHDSTSGLDNTASRLAVMNAVLRAVPPTRYVLIRYPYEKRENWQGPLNAATAWDTSDAARIGHHNDCFLDGDDDAGTYHSADDKTYLAADSFYVPLGGETCAVQAPRTDCASATADLATYHWAFLNADFDKDVLNSWTFCMPDVVNRLGYRLTLQDASLNLSTSASAGLLQLSLHVVNSGYARMYNARPVNVVLTGSAGRKVFALTGIDPRRWDPAATTPVNARVNLGSLAPGTYAVSLWLPDAAPGLQAIADYSVQFANVNMWDATNGDNVLTRNFVVR